MFSESLMFGLFHYLGHAEAEKKKKEEAERG